MKTKIKRHSRSVISVILAVCMLVSCMTVGLIATDAARISADESVGDWNIKDSIQDAKVYGNFNYDSPSTQSEWTYNQMNQESSNHYWATFILKASTTYDFKLQSKESDTWKFRGANGSEFTFTSSATEYNEPVDSNDQNFHVSTKSSGSGYVSVRFDYWGEYSGRCKLFVTQQDVSNFYIHKSTSDQGATTASGTAMTNSSGTYTTTLSKNTDHYLMFNASSTASKMELATYAKVLSDKITLEAGGSAGSGDYAGYTEITKDWSQVKIVKVRCNTKDISVAFHPSTGKVEFDTITTIADNYYLGGRLTIKDGSGDPVYTGNSEGDWGDPSHAPTNKLAFTQVTAGTEYTVDTHCTISELSDPARHNNKEPLFIVYDSSDNVYATTGDAGLTFHTNIDSSKANITEFSGTLQKANEFLFDDVENNSDGLVTIHYDPTHEKIWYTLTGETPALAANATLSVEPSSTTTGTRVTLTAGHGTLTDSVTEESLTYTFYKNGVQIASGPENEIKDIEQDVRTNTYKVVISTSVKYSGETPYREVWAKQNADFTNPDYFRTNVNLYGLDDDARETAVIKAASWYSDTDVEQGITAGAMPHGDDYTFDVTLSAGQTYEFALCKTAIPDGDKSHLKDNRADEFFVDMSDSMYCDITSDSVTVSYQDGEETVRYTVTTYKVTPRTGCANATIHINTNGYARTVGSSTRYYPGRIYALSTYAPTRDNTIDNHNSETITYYFAEDKDNADTTLSGAGVRIAYWNNSKDVIQVNEDFQVNTEGETLSSDPKDAIDKNAVKVSVTTPAYYDTTNNKIMPTTGTGAGTAGTHNKIYVDMQELFDCGFGSATTKEFYVYKVELPVWATSFVFLDKDDKAMDTRNIRKNYGEYTYGTLLLNPNRVYLFYQDDNENHYKYTKAVVLDKGLWSSTTKNHPGTRTFKSNVINYNKQYDSSKVKKVNGQDSLNFDKGYTGGARSGLNDALTGFKISNNLAMRYKNVISGKADESDERYYFASIQGLVAEKLDADNLNSNGFPLLQSYSDQGKTNKINMPLFDYAMLAKDKTTSQNTIIDRQYLGVNFPMYESSFNGIKTYSYDSSTDKNRSITNTNGVNDFAIDTYRIAKDDLGYQPFVACDAVPESVDKRYGNATELDVKFYMSNTGQIKGADGTMQDIVFNFTGDDDVWVYVDGVLVLDLGGAHKASAGSINFSDMKVYYKTAAKNADEVTGVCSTSETWPAGKSNIYTVDMAALMAANGVRFSKTDAATEHTFQMFYMERGEIDSNMSVSFNLPQASGLNIRNKVTFDHVNPGLLGATQYSSNKDYFTFGVDSALSKSDSGHDVENVSAAYSNVKNPATTGSTAAATPVFPAHSATNHVFSTSYNTRNGKGAAIVNKTFNGDNGAYPLTRSDTTLEETGENEGSKEYYQTNEFGDPNVVGSHFVDHVPYTITDTLLQPVTEGDTNQEVVGVTSSTGQLRLLGTQMATFDDKFLPGSFVKVYMTQHLGEVDPSGKVIKYKSVADNNVGNYYITSYSIQDNHSSTWIKELTNVPLMHDSGEDIYAEDLSNNTDNCFYFSDYGTNGNTETAAMTVEYINDVAVGDIRIKKDYNGEDDPDFTFYLKFSQIFGDSSDQTADAVEYTDLLYDVYKSDGVTPVHRGVKYGRAGIVIKKGEIAVISGVPVETRYQVIEDNRAGSYLSEIDKKIYDAHNNEGIPHATPTHGYFEHFAEAQITGSGRTGTSTNSETINGDVYHVNMIPRVSESAWHGDETGNAHWDDSYATDHANQIYKTTSLITFTNRKTMIKVMLKYYDRVVQNGSETGLSNTPTSYTYRISQADIDSHRGEQWYTYTEDGGVSQLQSIDYAKIVSFVTGKAGISNVIADYTFWTSNAAALEGIKNTTRAYYSNGETADSAKYSPAYTDEQLAYHTDYVGVPVSDRARTDKWVCFKDNKGAILDFDAPSSSVDYASIATIEVWGYNTPKKYSITTHNLTVAEGQYVEKGTEYAAGGVTYDETSGEAPAYIVGTGASNPLSNYLYNTRVGGAYWAHLPQDPTQEQINAENDKVALLNRPSTYFRDGYGLTKGYTGEYPAAEKDFRYVYTNSSNDQVTAKYVFAYWASDPKGKNKITTDYQYGYRITKTMDIYPVYVLGSANEGTAVSITASQPDMYTKNDTLYRRINNIIGVYNVKPNDDKLTELAVLYVRLGKDANNGKTTEVDVASLDVNAIKNNYLAALAELDSWGYAKAATVYIDVTAETTPQNASNADKRRGTTYKYQVSFEPAENMPSTQVLLNNKNRMMMTHGFNNDLFAENAAFHKMLCFAAAKYDGQWIASDNYVYYYEGGIPQQ